MLPTGLRKTAVALVPAVAIGLAVGALVPFAAEFPVRRLAAGAMAIALLIGGVISRQPKRVWLFCWVITLTYNRNYMVEALGAHGNYGLYWSPADVFLFALLGLWAYESVVQKQAGTAMGSRIWPWFLPFAVACVCSIAFALRKDWVVFELTRVARFGAILAYARFNIRREEWWVCVAGFACAVMLQAMHGLTYVATGAQLGLSGLFGVGDKETLRLYFEGGLEVSTRRAAGTLGHANTLAAYLLLVTPIFLALTLRKSVLQLFYALLAVTALALLAVTMSRTPWVIIIVQGCLVLAGAVVLRMLTAKRAAGIAVLAASVVAISAMPFTDAIYRRLTEDFKESVDFRASANRIALDMWRPSPIVGVGLNNYSDITAKRDEDEYRFYSTVAEYGRLMLDIRFTAWVHNVYLLLLAETGAFGLMTFLLFASRSTVLGVRAFTQTRGAWQAATLGLTVGILGVYAHALGDPSLWIDPVTYTFALVTGMVNVAPDLATDTSSTFS